jgi:hypothetical protein
MAEKPDPLVNKTEPQVSKQESRDGLTEAQRDFAKLLGRLLAQRWMEQQNTEATRISKDTGKE